MDDPIQTPPSATGCDDRRVAERTACTLEVAVADAQKAFLPATVLDLSEGGVKLMVDPPPAPGEELRLTFLTKAGRLFQIAATAVHYFDQGGAWAVGCRFARILEEDELAELL